jgi:hypothetical protein
MTLKKKNVNDQPSPIKPNAGWEYSTKIQINGRNIIPGTELKITGERGRFRFIHAVTTQEGNEWIDVWGGPKKAESTRSFRVERVKTVHYKNTTDQALVQEYKAKKIAMKAELEED